MKFKGALEVRILRLSCLFVAVGLSHGHFFLAWISSGKFSFELVIFGQTFRGHWFESNSINFIECQDFLPLIKKENRDL